MHENMPFVSRDGMLEFLIENDGLSKSSAETYCKPSNDKFIGLLVNADAIRVFGDGWVINNDTIASAFMIEKNG
jgi:hypothetical protein